MKICAIICEYNPFHNGHLHQINEAKRISNADALLCLMSGNFVQRGEAAIFEKHVRAKHAIVAGAAIVLELPTVFASSNAELFAQGAIHILSSIPAVSSLCFGCENANKETLLNAASLLNNEPKEISQKIKNTLALGLSYAKARALAWEGYIPSNLLSYPNNILGIEYTKAILKKGANIDILPIQRIGGGYNDKELNNEYSSASAIRTALANGQVILNDIPSFVADDLNNVCIANLELLEKYALLTRKESEIAKISDCTEGLENALKKAAESDLPLIETLTSARYTSSRIRRIALQNLLKIDISLIKQSLQSSLYCRVLAAKKERSDVLAALGESSFPILARAHDDKILSKAALACYQKDLFAEKIYGLFLNKQTVEKKIFI